MELRPYQEKNLQEIRAQLKHHRSCLYCLPCGGGKGTVCSVIVEGAKARGNHVTFVVRGRSLVLDMSARVSRLGIEHGVLLGGAKRQHWHPVQVASLDTLHRMKNRPPAEVIILDEARMFMSETGRKVLDDYPNAKIIGLDATPMRLDGQGLGAIFDTMVMGPNEQELIDQGYLCPSIPIGTPAPPDVSQIRKSGGDFNQGALAEACDKVKLVGDIVEHWLREASDRKTVAFAVNQAHARHITKCFREAGIEWAYVSAETPNDERAAIWDGLENGTLMGVSNCGVCLVGWDLPRISCIISARPTASLSLWRQMMGRGSRLYPGKKDFLIIDHSGNLQRHMPHGWFELPPVWTLDGKLKASSAGEPISMCKIPIPVPVSGPLEGFTGPLSKDGRMMLPGYHMFKSGPQFCPYCGIPLSLDWEKTETLSERDGVILTAPGQLINLEAMRRAAQAEALTKAGQWKQESRKVHYLALFADGVKRNVKPGQATMLYKQHYGEWPSSRWRKEAMALHGLS